jgi:hypothetical protein
MFYTRNTLHRRAYQHKTTTIIEDMIVEALLAADPFLNFGTEKKPVRLSQTIDNMKAYTKVTDQVYNQILCSTGFGLKKARKLLKRIEKRNLYKFVGESRPPENSEPLKEDVKGEIAKRMVEYSDGALDRANLIVQIVNYNYGQKERNPVNNVRFYSKADEDKAFPIPRSEVSNMLPSIYSEQYVRVYSRDADQVGLTRECFKQFCEMEGYMALKGRNAGMASKRPSTCSQKDDTDEPCTSKRKKCNCRSA